MKNIDRRFFLKSTAAGLAGTSVWPCLNLAGCSAPAQHSSFMGGLTIVSIIEDVAALAVAGGLVNEKMTALLQPDINKGIPANAIYMGALVKTTQPQAKSVIARTHKNVSDIFAGKTAEEAAAIQKDRSRDEMKKKETLERKIALMLGWAIASGVRDILLPLYAKHSAPGNLPSEMQIYHDMFILKQKAALPGLANTTAADVAHLFNGMNPRMIARTHTLTPDYDDGPNWTLRITRWRKDIMDLNARYAKALVSPDTQKNKQYIEDVNFYNAGESILALSRGKTMSAESVHNALAQSAASLYAQCVSRGTEALMSLNHTI